MSGTASRSAATGELTAVSVHGPRGVLDVTVPRDATLAEVARTYAEQSGLPHVLPLVTRAGGALPGDATIEDVGLVAGAVLVAVDHAPPSGARRASMGMLRRTSSTRPGALSALWFCVAAALALLAGWSTALLPDDERTVPVVVLVVAALVGCLPIGPLTAQRVVTAPAFAAAAAFAVLWDGAPERWPTTFGAAALVAAVTAAVGRALTSDAAEALRVWIIVGVGWFLIAIACALLSREPQVVWAVLFLSAVLAARLVPLVSVDVPDAYLLDLERLAVTAWSARERPAGRRGRIVVPEETVAAVAVRGARTITATAVAILAVVGVSAPLLLASTNLPVDQIGARCMVGFGGAALLFAGRSYRHSGARRLLRLAGIACLAAVALVLLAGSGADGRTAVVAVAVAVAGLLVVVGVALGRGWRSAWWARKAEIAEALCGAGAVGSVVVAVGLFRHLWELTS